MDSPPSWGTQGDNPNLPPTPASLLASKVFKYFPGIGCQSGAPHRPTWLQAISNSYLLFMDPLLPSGDQIHLLFHTYLPTWPFFPQEGRGL